MLCPVCLDNIGVTHGVVRAHLDGVGKVCPMSGREPFVWDENSARAAIPSRSGHRCEYCLEERATNIHHRKARSQGGNWSPSNCLHLCGSGTTGCHGYFTEHPEEAYGLGVSVRSYQTPEDVPVDTKSGRIWLTDDIAPPFGGARKG